VTLGLIASLSRELNVIMSKKKITRRSNHGDEVTVPSVMSLSQTDLPEFSKIYIDGNYRHHCKSSTYSHNKHPTPALSQNVPSARHWACMSSPSDGGLSIRCVVDHDLHFHRLDKYSQRHLVSNIKQLTSYFCDVLRRIHKCSRMRAYFRTWKLKMEYDIRFAYSKQFRYRAKSGTLLKTAFLSWKYVVSCGTESSKNKLHSITCLYSTLYHNCRKKLKNYLYRWRRWSKHYIQESQRTFDNWVIYTYKTKLAQCNALKFVKYLVEMSLEHSYRKHKSRKKYFFGIWHQKTVHYANFMMKRKFYDQWCSYKTILENLEGKVAEMYVCHTRKRSWRYWRVAVVMTTMWSKRSDRLLQQVM